MRVCRRGGMPQVTTWFGERFRSGRLPPRMDVLLHSGLHENHSARGGDRVRIVMLDVEDRRPVEDVLWTESDYRALYAAAHLEVIDLHRPLGNAEDPWTWVSETHTSPWAIYVLGKGSRAAGESD